MNQCEPETRSLGMPMSSRELKTMAREMLHGHYTRLSLFVFTHFILGLLVSYIPIMAFPDVSVTALFIGAEVLAYILTVLVDMTDIGLTKATLCVVRMEPYSFGDILYAYRNSRDAFLIIQILLTAVTTALNIPLLFLQKLTESWGLGLYEYYMIYLAWVFLSTFLSILLTLRIRFAILVLMDHPDWHAGAALKESLRLTKGQYGRLFRLQLSFLGMYVLSVASFYLGFLLVNSYIRTTSAILYEDFRREDEAVNAHA